MRVRRNILTKTILLKKKHNFIIVFGLLGQNFRTGARKFSVGLSNLHSTCSEERLRKKYRKTFTFEYFRTLSEIFSDFLQKVFGLEAKKVRQGCQNCILPGQMNIFGVSKNFLNGERNWDRSVKTCMHLPNNG